MPRSLINRIPGKIRGLRALFVFVQGVALIISCVVPAGASLSHLCDQAARDAARAHDVPLEVLTAITRTETGRVADGILRPWPWTVNMEGAGRWFDTKDAARAFVFKHFKTGARSFDVGCFQLNFRWHGEAFASIDDMFDPELNADYAARFLSELFTEFGDWSKAAGAYHSRTPEFAKLYRARFDQIRQGPNNAAAPPLRRRAVFGPPSALGIDQILQGGALIGAGVPRLGSTVPLAFQNPADASGWFKPAQRLSE